MKHVHPTAIRDHQAGFAQLRQVMTHRGLTQVEHRREVPGDLLTGSRTEQIRHNLDPDRIGEGIRRLAAVIETEMQLRDDFGPMSAS